ncbi:MAG: Gfo/Idh/MocA family protein [Bacteroidales bacterium]
MENNRRDFLKKAGAITVGGALASTPIFASGMNVYSGSSDTIRVGMVGCGGRCTGAAVQTLNSKQNVKIVAMADPFKDQMESSLKNLKENAPRANMVTISPDTMFDGFDGYKSVIDACDVVLIATPPGFRPIHFEYAVAKGKHVFMEKPVAVDPWGVNKVLEVAKQAKQKKLNVIVGLQRHYQQSYLDMYDIVKSGKIGDILQMRSYWNGGGVWVRERKPQQSEMEYQMRNWYYFNWLCGDHIDEQHVHNIDVCNWFLGDYPTSAYATGGRQVRKGKDHGEIFDHFYTEFHYKNGVRQDSQCRHWAKCANNVSEYILGTKGYMDTNGQKIVKTHKGKVLYSLDKEPFDPYQHEIDLLFAAFANGEYKFEDATNAAHSTLCAIIGRMSAYSGQIMKTDEVLKSNINIAPKLYAWDAEAPVKPNESGYYPVAKPGETSYNL